LPYQNNGMGVNMNTKTWNYKMVEKEPKGNSFTVCKQTKDTITFYTRNASLTSDMYFNLEDMR